jgi:hypothetical protein
MYWILAPLELLFSWKSHRQEKKIKILVNTHCQSYKFFMQTMLTGRSKILEPKKSGEILNLSYPSYCIHTI